MENKGIVPVSLSLPSGDYYTLWAPKWREHGAEWQAFLGSDDDLYLFPSAAHLLVFLESGAKHDLTTHPKWGAFESNGANRVVPRHHYDLVGVPGMLAGRPSHENVSGVARALNLCRSLGEVTGNTTSQMFFASHSILANPNRGTDHFAGDQGLQEWSAIGRVILSNYKEVLDSFNATTTEVDESLLDAAQARIDEAEASARAAREEEEARKKQAAEASDPYDSTPWAAAGIDPIKIHIDGRTLYTLRTYIEAQPVFLGKFGQIFTFNSSKAMLRWLEHEDHDLAKVATWEDLMVHINAGELEVTVHPDNVYSFNGIAKAIEQGIDAVDTDQMARAYELLADAADWAQDDSLNAYFLANPRMQDYISYMLGSNRTTGYTPTPPFIEHAEAWKELESMLTARFSKF